ncbi:putative integral membrane protein (TIGR02206 family) [Cytobacillus eiseniae]|uniref:Integral membrane protein (TIGR02206 family) n=2 Tax=Cytobacillus eiseniae TaxID=762947 RepID=A0ABS4RC36_9BACI|nr:putative integral membrane protein (TIGR02206 family) [Cytobacillus eiseniae]
MSMLFGHQYDLFPFEVFSISHILMIVLLVSGAVALYYFRSYFRKKDQAFRSAMFMIMFLLETMYHIWLIKDGYWNLSFTLPLQLCSLSLLLCLILLVTKSQIIFQIVYFIGIIGAFMAILTPELFLGFPHFRYFQFFITHLFIIWTCLYFVFVHTYRPTRRGMITSFLFLNGSAIVAFMVNKLTDGNYMFLAKKPTNGSLLDYFGPYPYYILTLEAAAIFLFFFLLLPFVWKDRAANKLFGK